LIFLIDVIFAIADITYLIKMQNFPPKEDPCPPCLPSGRRQAGSSGGKIQNAK
jgi:hypothetical protein